jgi:hypothetical protein
MKKEDIQIVINGKTVFWFEPVSLEIRYDGDKTWYAIEGFVPHNAKKKPRVKTRRG